MDITYDDTRKYHLDQIPIFPKIKLAIKSKLDYNLTTLKSNMIRCFDSVYINLKIHVENPPTKLKLKKKITEFIELDTNIKNELRNSKYSHCINNMYNPLVINELTNDSANIKDTISNYLENILKNPFLITDCFIEFLGLKELKISKSFQNERKKYIEQYSKDRCENVIIFNETRNNTSINSTSSKMDKYHEGKKIIIKDIKVNDMIYINSECKFILSITYDLQIKTLTKNLSEIEQFLKEIDHKVFLKLKLILNKLVKEEVIRFLEFSVNALILKWSENEHKNRIINNFFKEFNPLYFTPVSDITMIQKLAYDKQISNIRVEIPSFSLLECDFKIQVFYDVNWYFLMNNNSLVNIHLKYKYKELIEFINGINIFLGIKTNLYDKTCSVNNYEKLQKRKCLLESCLTRIFMNYNNTQYNLWLNILNINKAYQNFELKQNFLNKNNLCTKKGFFCIDNY